MNTSETLSGGWCGVVFVLLGEASGRNLGAACKSQASRHGDESWKHRTPPPWHHHTYTQTLKGALQAVQAVVKRFCGCFFDETFCEDFFNMSHDTIANTTMPRDQLEDALTLQC